MAIPFNCPHCGQHTEVAEEYAGQTGPCVHCGKTVTVPPLSGTPGYTTPTKGSSVPLVVLLVVVVLGLLLFLCGGVFFLAFPGAPAPMPPPVVATSPAMGPTVTTAAAPAAGSVEVAFDGPEGMAVSRADTSAEARMLTVPLSLYLPRGATYPLHVANVPGHPGVQFAATLQIERLAPTADMSPEGAIQFELTERDFQQALDGKPVTKVVHLPKPEFRQSDAGGVETLVSTELESGADAAALAGERGDILAVLRLEGQPD